MKLLILAGGLGTRLREETEYKPKPMVEVGGHPIIWHLMKIYGCQGIEDFVIALGYKGEVIKSYFRDFELRENDVQFDLEAKSATVLNLSQAEKWKVTLAETGPYTMTGGRILKSRIYLDGQTFMCAYGDGLADIDIQALLAFHKSHGKIATVTAATPTSRFGMLEIASNGLVESFAEKPIQKNWVNAGFFVFEPEIFDFLTEDTVLEREPLENLVKAGQLMAYRHEGYWQPMDTLREAEILNEAWRENAPWKVWK